MPSKFVRDNLITLATRAVTVLSSAAFSVIVARTLGPSGKGIASLAAILIIYAGTLGTLGIEHGSIYLLGGDRKLWGKVFANALLVSLAMSVLLGGATLAGFPLRGYVGLSAVSLPLWAVVAAAIPLALTGKTAQAMLQAREAFRRFNLVDVARALSLGLLGGALLLWARIGVAGVLISLLVSVAAGAALALGLALDLGKPSVPHAPTLKRALWYGVKADAGQAVQTLNYRLDAFILAALTSVGAVGIYQVAVGLVELLWQLSSTIATTLFPRTAAQTEAEAALFTAKVLRVTTAVTLLASCALALLSRWLILLLYGAAFADSADIVLILLPGVFLFGLTKVVVSYIMGRGDSLFGTLISSAALVLTVALDLYLIPRHGIAGAATATLVVYAVTTALALRRFKRQSGLPLTSLFLLRREDVGALVRLVKR